jgi:hypothetical protein
MYRFIHSCPHKIKEDDFMGKCKICNKTILFNFLYEGKCKKCFKNTYISKDHLNTVILNDYIYYKPYSNDNDSDNNNHDHNSCDCSNNSDYSSCDCSCDSNCDCSSCD